MPYREHLTTLRFASALYDSCIKEKYTLHRFKKDVLAGITVGVIAIPLSMALAIASGVPPQNGLYTAIFAGFIIALTGGSRFSVSGPTAAFVVILFPVSQQFGLGGLLVASLMAGFMLLGMALARLGRLIEYIPEAVTLGFTAGIAVVIATLQVKDFFGLQLTEIPESYIGKVEALYNALPDTHWPSLLVAVLTFATLVFWPRLKIAVPGHLPALVLGALTALALSSAGYDIETIGSRFTYSLSDGTTGFGIPAVFPDFIWPWAAPGPDGKPIVWSLQLVEALFPAAFSIAMLGAIESLLCAVVLDGMTGKRHNANGELFGQSLGNLVAPFFGGITATAAIARSATNYRAGAQSPIAAVIHAAFVLMGLIALAPLLAYLPMASLAALLIIVAWNMSEAHKLVALCRRAPMSDIATLAICFSLTVLFDMVIAITVGIVIASLLFMRNISKMTKISDISDSKKHCPNGIPNHYVVYKINGPLFFAAADRVFSELEYRDQHRKGVILYMDGVSILDAGGLSSMIKYIEHCAENNIHLIIADLQSQPLKTVAKAHIDAVPDRFQFTDTLAEALEKICDPNWQTSLTHH